MCPYPLPTPRREGGVLQLEYGDGMKGDGTCRVWARLRCCCWRYVVITIAGSMPELLICVTHSASSGLVIVNVIGAGALGCVVGRCICWSSGVDFCVIHVPILMNVSPIILRVERRSCDLPLLDWSQLFVLLVPCGRL